MWRTTTTNGQSLADGLSLSIRKKNSSSRIVPTQEYNNNNNSCRISYSEVPVRFHTHACGSFLRPPLHDVDMRTGEAKRLWWCGGWNGSYCSLSAPVYRHSHPRIMSYLPRWIPPTWLCSPRPWSARVSRLSPRPPNLEVRRRPIT